MEDRFLFRGISIHTDKFIVGALNSECFINGYHVHENTVGQCTGLKDKKGDLIFEGDILKWGQARQGSIIIVEWFGDEGRWGIPHSSITEIIGNIHDNPELLESDA